MFAQNYDIKKASEYDGKSLKIFPPNNRYEGNGIKMLTLENVYQASFVLKDIIRNTGLIHAPKINPDVDLYIKPENLQVTGSFKVRGAAYKISRLSYEEKAKDDEYRSGHSEHRFSDISTRKPEFFSIFIKQLKRLSSRKLLEYFLIYI